MACVLVAINISPLWGEATNNILLHFQSEFAMANDKWKMENLTGDYLHRRALVSLLQVLFNQIVPAALRLENDFDYFAHRAATAFRLRHVMGRGPRLFNRVRNR